MLLGSNLTPRLYVNYLQHITLTNWKKISRVLVLWSQKWPKKRLIGLRTISWGLLGPENLNCLFPADHKIVNCLLPSGISTDPKKTLLVLIIVTPHPFFLFFFFFFFFFWFGPLKCGPIHRKISLPSFFHFFLIARIACLKVMHVTLL